MFLVPISLFDVFCCSLLHSLLCSQITKVITKGQWLLVSCGSIAVNLLLQLLESDSNIHFFLLTLGSS